MRILSVFVIVAVLSVALASTALARRGEPTPPPEPVAIESICLERVGPGVGSWKTECNRVYASVVFDGMTQHAFCFLNANGTLLQAGVHGCPTNATPVTLTGDGSVDVCIGAYDILYQRGSSACLTPAII